MTIYLTDILFKIRECEGKKQVCNQKPLCLILLICSKVTEKKKDTNKKWVRNSMLIYYRLLYRFVNLFFIINSSSVIDQLLLYSLLYMMINVNNKYKFHLLITYLSFFILTIKYREIIVNTQFLKLNVSYYPIF